MKPNNIETPSPSEKGVLHCIDVCIRYYYLLSFVLTRQTDNLDACLLWLVELAEILAEFIFPSVLTSLAITGLVSHL